MKGIQGRCGRRGMLYYDSTSFGYCCCFLPFVIPCSQGLASLSVVLVFDTIFILERNFTLFIYSTFFILS